ncbi:MAG: 50S ribosomal protein L11 methyltransferase [Candidatus Dadabacteria bacterium]|nr:50S ribosomal protein L11 methyltransferase [Candidatus Dadabacteria bacterium]
MFAIRKLSLRASDEAKSLISDFLLGLDAMGVAEDIIEGEGFEVSAYFSKETDLNPVIGSLKNYLSFLRENLSVFSHGGITVEEIDRSSWEVWRNQLKTVRAGKRVVIRPPWEEYIPKDGEVVIEINPSMAFGTGHHETTRLCIQTLEEILASTHVKNVLDVGSGSGILAISASKLGVKDVTGLDIDPVAVREAKSNLERNSVSEKIKLLCGYIHSVRGRFDLILANITVEAILLMKKELRSRLDDNGLLLASGIPTPRRDELVSGLEKEGFIIKTELQEGGWVAVLLGIDNNST